MDDKLSDVFSTRFRLEADQAANPGVTAPAAGSSSDELVSGKMAPFMKEAWLTWKNIFDGSNFTFGLQLTPGFAISEAAWGYRFLEKTIMDQKGLVGAVDLGMSLRGKLNDDATLNYWLMIGNNDASGTIAENNKYKRYYGNIQWLPATNWQATAYLDYAGAAKISNSLANSTSTEAIFVGYGKSSLNSTVPTETNVGAEIFMQEQANGYTTPSKAYATRNALGYWVYGQYYFTPEIAVVARYDRYDPNTASDLNAQGDSRNYVLGGFVFKPDKNIYISPNVVYETYETPVSGIAIDASVTARLTFWYIYL